MENTDWRPKKWFSLLLSVLVGPFAFLYMNCAKCFGGLFVLTASIIAVDLYTGISIIWLASVLPVVSAILLLKKGRTDVLRRWYSRWWLMIFLLFFMFLFLLRAFLFQPFLITSNAMAPTLVVGDHVVVNKHGYGSYETFGLSLYDSAVSDSVTLTRGELYVFQYSEKNTPFIKRLIGLPGDKLEIDGVDIYLNNKLIEKKQLSTDSNGSIYEEVLGEKAYQIMTKNQTLSRPAISITVPEGHYFFMGDNRDNSFDSRHFGSVSEDDLIGKRIYVISPN